MAFHHYGGLGGEKAWKINRAKYYGYHLYIIKINLKNQNFKSPFQKNYMKCWPEPISVRFGQIADGISAQVWLPIWFILEVKLSESICKFF